MPPGPAVRGGHPSPAPSPTSAIRAYAQGVQLLGRGLARYARTPRLMVLGLIPVAVTTLLFAIALGVLLFFLGDLATAATWFADDWSPGARSLVRVLVGIAIVGAAVLLGVVSFTAFTLAIGEPFYERISAHVEEVCGGGPDEVQTGFFRSMATGLVDSARTLLLTGAVGVALFLAGFLPVVGQSVVPVLGATAGGWFLALELVGIPFSRRGLRLADRRRALRGHRARALGFGTAVFLCFLVPGGAVLVMPAAVAGGTLLARQALGLPISAGGSGTTGTPSGDM